MSDFHFADWRREMEQAIQRGEPIPIRVLLDQAERAFEDLLDTAHDALALWDDADHTEGAAAGTSGESS